MPRVYAQKNQENVTDRQVGWKTFWMHLSNSGGTRVEVRLECSGVDIDVCETIMWSFSMERTRSKFHILRQHSTAYAAAWLVVRLAGQPDQSDVVFTRYDSRVGDRMKSNMFDSSDRRPDRSDEAFTRYDRWPDRSRPDWSGRRSHRVNAQIDACYCLVTAVTPYTACIIRLPVRRQFEYSISNTISPLSSKGFYCSSYVIYYAYI